MFAAEETVSDNDPTFGSVTEEFFDMEDQLNLLDRKIDGTYFWERIRHGTHRQILNSLGLIGQAHSSTKDVFYFPRLNMAKQAIKNIFRKNPFLVSRRDLLFYGVSRRKKRDDGFWWDIYVDFLLEVLESGYIYYEHPYRGRHLSPAKTENLRYWDLVKFISSAATKAGIKSARITPTEEKFLVKIENEISDRFSVEVDLREKVRNKISKRKMLIPLYEKILRKVQPKLSIIVTGYYKKTFIEVCKNLGIPVIELQHGTIDYTQMGYSFPGKGEPHNFPDHLFTFGEFWSNNAEFPISNEHIHDVGFPFLESKKKEYEETKSRDQMIFVSQGTIGHRLSELAVKLNKHERFTSRLVYKLHPGEYDRWRDEYPWLAKSDVEVVEKNPSLYKLFDKSSSQIGVSSTALYEGAAFGLETYILDVPSAEKMQRFIRKGYGKKVSGLDEFLQLYQERTSTRLEEAEKNHLFKPDSLKNMKEIIHDILST